MEGGVGLEDDVGLAEDEEARGVGVGEDGCDGFLGLGVRRGLRLEGRDLEDHAEEEAGRDEACKRHE